MIAIKHFWTPIVPQPPPLDTHISQSFLMHIKNTWPPCKLPFSHAVRLWLISRGDEEYYYKDVIPDERVRLWWCDPGSLCSYSYSEHGLSVLDTLLTFKIALFIGFVLFKTFWCGFCDGFSCCWCRARLLQHQPRQLQPSQLLRQQHVVPSLILKAYIP